MGRIMQSADEIVCDLRLSPEAAHPGINFDMDDRIAAGGHRGAFNSIYMCGLENRQGGAIPHRLPHLLRRCVAQDKDRRLEVLAAKFERFLDASHPAVNRACIHRSARNFKDAMTITVGLDYGHDSDTCQGAHALYIIRNSGFIYDEPVRKSIRVIHGREYKPKGCS
jgi:hypothetical protein